MLINKLKRFVNISQKSQIKLITTLFNRNLTSNFSNEKTFKNFPSVYLTNQKHCNNFHNLNTAYRIYNKLFSRKNVNSKSDINNLFTPEQHDQMMKNFNEEFEQLLSSNEEDTEKRIKLLSIKLLQLNKSSEIINLFEEKYLKGLVSNIYGDELSLLVYFFVSLIEKEMREYRGNNYKIDKRFDKIFKMLESKINELDTTNLLALSWSMSILITKFNYEISDSFKNNFVQNLPKKIDIDKKGEIPAICYSISSFNSQTDNELNNLIRDKISNYSSTFCILIYNF